VCPYESLSQIGLPPSVENLNLGQGLLVCDGCCRSLTLSWIAQGIRGLAGAIVFEALGRANQTDLLSSPKTGLVPENLAGDSSPS
jgi:hypothetical protein